MNPAASTFQLSTPSDTEIRMTREFAAPRALVFEAWTRPEHLRRWLGREGDVMTVCDVDLRPGGAWRYAWALREGGEMGMEGVFREVVPPERLVTTTRFDPPYFDVMGGETLDSVTFTEHNGRTLVSATTVYQSRAARDSALGTDMESGVLESYGRLEALLAELQQR